MPDQTKDRIVEAAYRTLVKRGYHETSMKDIAAEAGVAPGLAHYYFETKEDLLVAAIERGCEPAMRAWSRPGSTSWGPCRKTPTRWPSPAWASSWPSTSSRPMPSCLC